LGLSGIEPSIDLPAVTPEASAVGSISPRRESLVRTAYQVIRRRILENVYAPGFQVLEQSLATELGISRTPLREALIRLENEGLINLISRHGMRVLPISPIDMKEIYEILASLESTAGELVAKRRPEKQELDPLGRASRDMVAALRADDLDAWAAADARFHRHLIELSGNRLLVQTVLGFWDRCHRVRMVTLRMRRKPTHSTREHLEIVDLIGKGDAPGAFEACRKHRERGSREQLDILERYQLQQL
jgi:DNA-binding GntR family transcriptional regulator